MKTDKVSIIIPVYNVKNFLKKCIDSVLGQTYTNIEVILVDDGSSDGSSDICDWYASNNMNVTVIHQKNMGLSSARNVGIRKSHGSYICFVDSDDYVSTDYVERLYDTCISNDAEIACCAKKIVMTKKQYVVNDDSDFCVKNSEALRRMFLFEGIDTSACDKLFKKELFDSVSFPVNHFYEDMGTIYKLLIKSKKVAHANFVGYYYVMRDKSISNAAFSLKQLDALHFAKEAFAETIKLFPRLYDEGESFYLMNLLNVLVKIKNSSNYSKFRGVFIDLKTEYKNNFSRLLKNKALSAKKKIMGVLVYFGFYKIVYLAKKKHGRI